MSRTPNQKLADKMDMELYRIVRRVEEAVADSRGDERRTWSEARFALATARGHIRSMMSDEDRRASV